MKEIDNASAPAADAAASADNRAPAPKTRRPRRMAREADTGGTPAGKPQAAAPTKPMPRSESKIASVITLLKRDEGATLEELVQATGWQPHTTRAALTGLRKKGHVIDKTKRGELTCYRIAEPA